MSRRKKAYLREVKEKVGMVLRFWKQYDKEYFMNQNNDIFVNVDFVNDFDEWATKRGYEILKSVKQLAYLQAYLLNKEINLTSDGKQILIPFFPEELKKQLYGM